MWPRLIDGMKEDYRQLRYGDDADERQELSQEVEDKISATVDGDSDGYDDYNEFFSHIIERYYLTISIIR